jgi:O-antigen ligase
MSFLRFGICLLLAFGVLAFGAVEEWAQAVLEIGFCLLFLLWALRALQKKWDQMFISPLLLPMCAFALVVVAQLALHRTFSPYQTRVELQLVVAYTLALFLISQAYQRTSHWRNFLWFLMSLGFFVSIFGILQHLTFNGKLYWARTMRFGGYPFGPYVNRNHFAGFAELIIPIALVPLVLGRVRRERLALVGLFAAVPIIALLLSASRGGIVSFAVEIAVLIALLLLRRIRGQNLLVVGALVLAVVMAASWIGVRQVVERFSGTRTADITSSKRASMRRDTWRIFLDHPVLGTGLGTLPMVFPPYDSLFDDKIVNHSHNDYLEILADSGILGGICCAWFLMVLFTEGLKGLAAQGNSLGGTLNLCGLMGCSGFLIHSLVDFNLHIPANALPFFVTAHLATVRVQPSAPGESLPRRRKRKESSGAP